MPNANDFLIEIAAINGNIYLTVHQGFEEDTLIKAVEEELKANGISCSPDTVLGAGIRTAGY